MKSSHLFLLSALLFQGCTPGPDLLRESVNGSGGKADNFYSDVAREYKLTGNIPVQMTAVEYADPMLRKGKGGQPAVAPLRQYLSPGSLLP